MKANEVVARLEELITDGIVKATIYRLNGEWRSVLVVVEEYRHNSGKWSVVIDNKGDDYINRQIAKLDAALHPGGLNHYWELTDEPEQLPALPQQIEIAI